MNTSAISYFKNLKEWAVRLPKKEKDICGSFKCQALFTLFLVNPEFDLLKAALRYWDTKTHTFRFGDKEVCPTPEEFGAIAGFTNNDNMAMPSLPGEYFRDFSEMLDMPDIRRCMVEDNFASVKVLVDYYSPAIVPGDNRRSPECRHFALCLTLVHHFLFFSNNEKLWGGLIRVMKQIQEDKSPMVMSLAETIMSLDNAKQMDVPNFEGGVILLQIWLLERLGRIAPPRDRFPYKASDFYTRKRLYDAMNDTSWAELFVDPKIKWFIPEWNIRRMRYVDGDFSYVSLIGIWEITFILPKRIMRQYGMRQILPWRDPNELELPSRLKVCQRELDHWPRFYVVHPIVKVATELIDATLDPLCERWMKARTQAERDAARTAMIKDKARMSRATRRRPEDRLRID